MANLDESCTQPTHTKVRLSSNRSSDTTVFNIPNTSFSKSGTLTHKVSHRFKSELHPRCGLTSVNIVLSSKLSADDVGNGALSENAVRCVLSYLENNRLDVPATLSPIDLVRAIIFLDVLPLLPQALAALPPTPAIRGFD